jgi:uncharacterized DUF497 family protein
VKFEWDAQKAELNFKKHGVTLEEASTVFGDPLAARVATRAIPSAKVVLPRWASRRRAAS